MRYSAKSAFAATRLLLSREAVRNISRASRVSTSHIDSTALARVRGSGSAKRFCTHFTLRLARPIINTAFERSWGSAWRSSRINDGIIRLPREIASSTSIKRPAAAAETSVDRPSTIFLARFTSTIASTCNAIRASATASSRGSAASHNTQNKVSLFTSRRIICWAARELGADFKARIAPV